MDVMAKLTPMQTAAAAYLGGFRGGTIAEAVAVAIGESGLNVDISNACCDGLWQIHRTAHADKIRSAGGNVKAPAVNAKLAYQIYSGDWCGGRAPNGHCNKWEAYGLDNAGMTWARKLEVGRKAKADLDRRVGSIQLRSRATIGGQVGGPPTYGAACEQILTEAGVSAEGAAPEWPLGSDIGDALGVPEFFRFPEIEGLAKGLKQGSTWVRVAEVLLGGVLIVVAVVTLVPRSVVSATPLGKVAKVLR